MTTVARLFIVGAVCALAAACGSTGSTTATPTTSSVSASAYTGATLTCEQYKVRAANLISYVHYASLNVGTTNESTSYFAEMQQAMADLKANATACAAAGAAALAELQASVDSLEAGYQASDAAADVAANKKLFEALVAKGVLAWTALGYDTQGWDTVLRFTA